MTEEKNPVVQLQTSLGDIRIELRADKAPVTVANFLAYVRDNFYEGTVFHRVISNFMIQGGGMTDDLQPKKTRAAIKNEAGNGLQNKRGSVAMARTQVVDSATAQFFINVTDNDFLDHRNTTPAGFGYAVFGQVVGGMEVVDAIRQVPTGRSGMHDDVPRQAIVIEKVTEIS